MKKILIRNAAVVNEGSVLQQDVLIQGERIERIDNSIAAGNADVIDGEGKHLFPGFIDDQVHFREPGLIHKGDLRTESIAAVAGGITSFMEMPNTVPNTLTQSLLNEKYALGAARSVANYSFFMGASNDNIEEVLKTDAEKVCGIKIFMGSSTGNMLVDNARTLENIFSRSPMLIAVHCEDEATVRENMARFKKQYGDDVKPSMHPLIRNEEACYRSSSMAVSLARQHGTRLHVLHLSTARELALFDNALPLEQKRITAEACIHHLWFDDSDYERLGTLIKWNPAIKSRHDRDAIRKALADRVIDIVATDHAPHTLEEKQRPYFEAPSGGPLVQHALVALLELHRQGVFTLEQVAARSSHDVARCFRLLNRGYIREGYMADLVLVDLNSPWTVNRSNILAKCGWSPFEGTTFHARITHTYVNGRCVYENGRVDDSLPGQRLEFEKL